jgi:hypothetical protein
MTFRILRQTSLLLALGFLPFVATSAHADRIVLAPRGLITPPFSLGAEYAVRTESPHADIGWLNLGFPQEDLGLEIELERLDASGPPRETFSLQYSLTGNGVVDFAPALSVGIRDVLRRGRERQGIFAAASKSIGVPLATERFLRNLKVHVGYGASAMDGLFAGADARILGLWVGAEYLARKFNASVALPLFANLSARAYTLDGSTYIGASFVLRR